MNQILLVKKHEVTRCKQAQNFDYHQYILLVILTLGRLIDSGQSQFKLIIELGYLFHININRQNECWQILLGKENAPQSLLFMPLYRGIWRPSSFSIDAQWEYKEEAKSRMSSFIQGANRLIVKQKHGERSMQPGGQASSGGIELCCTVSPTQRRRPCAPCRRHSEGWLSTAGLYNCTCNGTFHTRLLKKQKGWWIH